MINLVKGDIIDLRKENCETYKHIRVGLGWVARSEIRDTGSSFLNSLFSKFLGGSFIRDAFDLDASVLILKDGRLKKEKDCVFYNNTRHNSGAVIHLGDNLTGNDGNSDAEQIIIDLTRATKKVTSIVIFVNIYKAFERGQNFGQVHNAYIRLIDDDTHEVIACYDLTGDYNNKTAVIIGEFIRTESNEWKFKAIGEGNYCDSVSEVADMYS